MCAWVRNEGLGEPRKRGHGAACYREKGKGRRKPSEVSTVARRRLGLPWGGDSFLLPGSVSFSPHLETQLLNIIHMVDNVCQERLIGPLFYLRD